MHPETLAVIGLGAIGGSVAWQARSGGVPRVMGYSNRPAEGVQALKAGAITHLADTLDKAVRDADLVVLAAPPEVNLGLLERIAGRIRKDALVTDVGSVKTPAMEAAASAGLADRFAGGHPLAGTERSGFAAARPDRFKDAIVYVCPSGTPRGDRAAREVMNFWSECLGAHPVLINAEDHDRQLAWSSHLPQAVASALASTLHSPELVGVTFGTGARDTTRLAASDPELWIGVFLQNRVALDAALCSAVESLENLRELVATGDTAGLRSYLQAARAFRRGLDS